VILNSKQSLHTCLQIATGVCCNLVKECSAESQVSAQRVDKVLLGHRKVVEGRRRRWGSNRRRLLGHSYRHDSSQRKKAASRLSSKKAKKMELFSLFCLLRALCNLRRLLFQRAAYQTGARRGYITATKFYARKDAQYYSTT
jgi:hypothetical protein